MTADSRYMCSNRFFRKAAYVFLVMRFFMATPGAPAQRTMKRLYLEGFPSLWTTQQRVILYGKTAIVKRRLQFCSQPEGFTYGVKRRVAFVLALCCLFLCLPGCALSGTMPHFLSLFFTFHNSGRCTYGENLLRCQSKRRCWQNHYERQSGRWASCRRAAGVAG